MPPLPGMELGPPPPAAPRTLPPGFVTRTRWTGNIATLVGGLFFLIGAVIAIPMLVLGLWLPALFPLFFVLGGFFMFRYGLVHAGKILRAFREGVSIKGTIASISLDTTQSINGQHPWKLVYHFTADGQLVEGKITSFDSTIAERRSRQPVWVLYVATDPSQNTLYPPVK